MKNKEKDKGQGTRDKVQGTKYKGLMKLET